MFKLYHKYDIRMTLDEKLKSESSLLKRVIIVTNTWLQLSIKGFLLDQCRAYTDFSYEKFKNGIKGHSIHSRLFKYLKLLPFLTGRIILIKFLRLDEKKIYKIFNRVWKNEKDEIIYSNYPRTVDFMNKFYNYKHDIENNIWYDERGYDIYNYFPQPQDLSMPPVISCNHLNKEIYRKFKVKVNDDQWHHWNGGVFLFDSSSGDFMETWHNYTLEIFKDRMWKVRNQETLVATAWKYRLQDHPRLPAEYNFIADFYKPEFGFDETKRFSIDNFRTAVTPYFIHIYYKYGKRGWDVWDFVESKLPDDLKDSESTVFFKKKYSE